ncbi:MAG: siroheme synthase CysG [Pseudohongiellaceae bacterium]
MELLPIFVNIRGRKCVVVGGGEVALRKATLLARAGAALHVVAETVAPALERFCGEHGATVEYRRFADDCLDGAVLVVAATDDRAVNARVSAAARQRNIPVNAVDQPELCTFIMPAIVDRSPVIVAISTGGASPILTRQLKELNEVMLPDGIDKLAELLREQRTTVQDRLPRFDERIRFWESVLASEIPELVYGGNMIEAQKRLQQRLESREEGGGGEVYLVGAGPGDPDLLTLRALRLMHKADVVLYDRLVSPAILQKVRPDAEKIHVGKQRSRHTVSQETINDMLVRLAREGKRVLRLKGGDPFIFGRGGEELESLARNGIPFQVVPGITAASGCAAYAGIPLTHRDHAQSVRFLPGHLKDGSIDLDWDSLARGQETLVFYMGLVGLPTICGQLIEHGMPGGTPIAIVQQGTTDRQRVITGDLDTLPMLAEKAGLQAPTLIIVGDVVKLRQSLSWYQTQSPQT